MHRNEMQYRSYIYSGHINSKKLEYNPVSIRALSWKYGNKISPCCEWLTLSKQIRTAFKFIVICTAVGKQELRVVMDDALTFD